MPYRHHDLSEIVYIKEGRGYFIINHWHYEASEGDILIYNKDVLHQEASDPNYPLKAYVIGIQNIHLNNIEDNCIYNHIISLL